MRTNLSYEIEKENSVDPLALSRFQSEHDSIIDFSKLQVYFYVEKWSIRSLKRPLVYL